MTPRGLPSASPSREAARLASLPAAVRAGGRGGAEGAAGAESVTELKPLGQVRAGVVVAGKGGGLWMIGPRVARERVPYEQDLRARREGPLSGQRGVLPLMGELSPRQLV